MQKTQNTFKIRKQDLGFTLVELIVVITILAILGTIGFISIQGYSSSARDSARISNLVNLHKWLTLFQVVGGGYPMPETPVTITASGTVIGYQGFARDQIAGMAKLSAGATRDPLDPSMYTTYSTNALQTKMQVMNFLEDGGKVIGMNLIPWVSEAFAAGANYSTRSPTSNGDTLGILLGSTGSTYRQPIQEQANATFTGVDIANTNTGYLAVFSKTTSITGTGSSLMTSFSINSTDRKNIAKYDASLIGYWDMETLSGSTELADLSSKWSRLISSGTMKTPGNSVGKIGKSTYFDGAGWMYLNACNWLQPVEAVTVSVWAKINQYNTMSWHNIIWMYGNAGSQSWGIWEDKFRIMTGVGTQTDISFTKPQLGEWKNYVITYDRSNFIWYLDGVRVNQVALTNAIYYMSCDMQIASLHGGPAYPYNGNIDEIRIYNKAFTDEEVMSLYNATK